MPFPRALVFFLSFVLLFRIVQSQNLGSDGVLEQRGSDWLRKNSPGEFFSASRYVPVVRFRGIGSWASPQLSVLIDGVPFDGFPLNMRSPDYVPLELLSLDSILVSSHSFLTPLGRMSGGAVNLSRAPLPDTLVIRGRVYAGSETGDPVLQKYTRDNLEVFNKNKIGISGAASIANRAGRIRYRIGGGAFGYFSTGYAGRDAIILSYIDRRMYARQNRNYLATAEMDYSGNDGRNVSLVAGINGIVGWEQMPFLPTLAFFEGYTNTLRVRMSEFLQNLDLSVRRDATVMAMRRQLGTEAGEYSATTYAFHPVWNAVSLEHTSVGLFGELTLREVAGSAEQFFDRDIRNTGWALGAALRHTEGDVRLSGAVRVERSITQSNEVSGQAEILYHAEGRFAGQITASSTLLEPNLPELHGTFTVMRDRPVLARTDTFRIRGNPELQTGRVHSLELTGEYGSEATSLSISLYRQIMERSIDRRIETIIRSSFPGDLVFSGTYVNSARRAITGCEVSFRTSLAALTNISATYIFTDNRDLTTIPAHRLRVGLTTVLGSLTILETSVHGQTKTVWGEFSLSPSNDDKAGIGSDGTTPQFWSLDISATQRLGTIWFGHEVTARLEIQNLLQRNIIYIPIGIPNGTAVLAYLSLRL